jgi:predicted Zn-ribbon and HTH transcriptional regulator
MSDAWLIKNLDGSHIMGVHYPIRDGGPKEMKTHTCKRCGHSWYPRRPELPVKCPKCQNPYWNKERIKKENPAK